MTSKFRVLTRECCYSSSFQVSSVGVTGTRDSVNDKVQSLLQQIKEATSKPVAVGFGISKPEHVKQVWLHIHMDQQSAIYWHCDVFT